LPEWRPKTLTNSVRAALAEPTSMPARRAQNRSEWGEKSLTPVERVFG